MRRLGHLLIAAVAVATMVGTAQAQERRLIAPVRGEAQLDITKPNTRVVKGEVVTTITVRNASSGAIAGLKVDENWYDKGGNPVGGDTYRHPRPLRQGEVVEITLTTPRRPTMDTNRYEFTHGNGTIKTNIVPKIEVPKPGQ